MPLLQFPNMLIGQPTVLIHESLTSSPMMRAARRNRIDNRP